MRALKESKQIMDVDGSSYGNQILVTKGGKKKVLWGLKCLLYVHSEWLLNKSFKLLNNSFFFFTKNYLISLNKLFNLLGHNFRLTFFMSKTWPYCNFQVIYFKIVSNLRDLLSNNNLVISH